MTPLKILIHLVGLSCIGGSVFLQCLVFFDIATQGYFVAVESNLYVLAFECGLTICSAAYFIFLWKKFLNSVRRKPS